MIASHSKGTGGTAGRGKFSERSGEAAHTGARLRSFREEDKKLEEKEVQVKLDLG